MATPTRALFDVQPMPCDRSSVQNRSNSCSPVPDGEGVRGVTAQLPAARHAACCAHATLQSGACTVLGQCSCSCDALCASAPGASLPSYACPSMDRAACAQPSSAAAPPAVEVVDLAQCGGTVCLCSPVGARSVRSATLSASSEGALQAASEDVPPHATPRARAGARHACAEQHYDSCAASGQPSAPPCLCPHESACALGGASFSVPSEGAFFSASDGVSRFSPFASCAAQCASNRQPPPAYSVEQAVLPYLGAGSSRPPPPVCAVHLRGSDILSEHLLPDAVLCVSCAFLLQERDF